LNPTNIGHREASEEESPPWRGRNQDVFIRERNIHRGTKALSRKENQEDRIEGNKRNTPYLLPEKTGCMIWLRSIIQA